VALALMLYAGLRPAEACGLRWEDIDLAAGVLIVAHTLPGGGTRYTDSGRVTDSQGPKWRAAGEARTVPMVDPLRELLADLTPGRARWPPTGADARTR
jgi:integrase